MLKKKILSIFLILVVGFIVLITILDGFVTVKYGRVGVLTRFGAVTGGTLQPGLHFKIPYIDKVVVYRTQKIIYETSKNPSYSEADYRDYPVDTTTKDGQSVHIRYTVRWSVDPAKAQFVAQNLGTEADVVEKIIKTDSRIHVRNIPRSFLASDLYTGDVEQVEEEIANRLDPILRDNGLVLDEFGIRNIEFDEEYQQTMEAKQIEKEKIQVEAYKAQQEDYRKKATITAAQAQAKAQKLQQQTLSKLLIKKMYIDKWDGKLPDIMSGSTPFIIDIKN